MTAIGFGTWAWGNKFLWGYDSEKDDGILEKTFNTAINSGLNFIDTADSYGTGSLKGRSEKLLGEYLRKLPKHKLNKIIVATKLAPYPWRLGREGFRNAFKSSKERLGGKIDRVQLHWSTARYAPWQEVALIDGLGDLFENGLISEIGVSNMGPNRLKWIHQRLKARGIPLKSLQIQFSLLSPDRKKLLKVQAVCQELNIDILAYSPLALGVLSRPPEDERLTGTFTRQVILRLLLPRSLRLRTKLKEIANIRGVSQAQVALNWCRAYGTTPIPGLRSPKQAKDVALAMSWKLSKQEVEALNFLSQNCSVRMPNNPFQSN